MTEGVDRAGTAARHPNINRNVGYHRGSGDPKKGGRNV